jgi:hypothetical protein
MRPCHSERLSNPPLLTCNSFILLLWKIPIRSTQFHYNSYPFAFRWGDFDFKWLARVPHFLAYRNDSFLEIETLNSCRRTNLVYLCEHSLAASRPTSSPSCVLELLLTKSHGRTCMYEPVDSSVVEFGVFARKVCFLCSLVLLW